MREYDVQGAGGVTVRAWEHGHGGPPVLISPGLGTIPEVWPSLLDRAAGVQLHSWYHRGTFGSSRPEGPGHVEVTDHVIDGIAVLDDAGIDRCTVVGWSMGVTVAVRLALQHPERVSGLLLIAGVPGAVFEAMGGMCQLPDPLRAPLVRILARGLRTAGPVLDVVIRRLPVTPATVWLLR
ncbi:MAG: alpha/beta hydrolase, partial [Actinomycetota bacterium]|nr:alpha/beta hydrolase [Actinomycetota bacterium]